MARIISETTWIECENEEEEKKITAQMQKDGWQVIGRQTPCGKIDVGFNHQRQGRPLGE
jgi:hypothetical protein